LRAITHDQRILEKMKSGAGIPPAISVIPFAIAKRHRFSGKGAQKRRKTPAIRAIATPETDRKYLIQLKIDSKTAPHPRFIAPFIRISATEAAFSVHAIAYEVAGYAERSEA
jgi:hypothetical protein